MLPEPAASAVATYRKNVDIEVGNVVGFNVFNIFFVLGISAVIHPLPFNIDTNVDPGIKNHPSCWVVIESEDQSAKTKGSK